MADNYDSAVGAVLDIPTEVLQKISQAEQRLKRLGAVSEAIAERVRMDWSITARSGLTDFIRNIGEAEKALQKIGRDGINFNINTTVSQQNLENLSNQTKKTETDISTVAQQSTKFLDQIDFSKPKESFEQLKITFGELEKELNNLISGRRATEVGTSEAQALNNIISSLREYINLQKQSDAEKDKASRKQADNSILLEQKNLLQQRLEIQKQINAEELRQQRSKDLGKAVSQDDINKLNDYKQRLDALNQSYDELKKRTSELSEKGLSKFNASDIKNELALNKELTASQEKLNQARQQAKTQLDETKLKSPGISSREEARYQAQLVGIYNQMIQVIKMKGDIEAKIASQGGTATQSQTNYLKALEAEYNRLDANLTKVAGKFAEIDRVTKSNFANAKELQLRENAVKLEDAEIKAAQAVQKRNQAYHDTSAITAKLEQLKQQILQEAQTLQQAKDKAEQAKKAMQDWMNINPTFNFHDASARLDELRNKIQALRDEASKKGPTKASMILDSAQFKALEQEYNALFSKVSEFLVLNDKVQFSNNNASNAMLVYSNRMASLTEESDKLGNELNRLTKANESINAEMQKGNTPATLAKEYKDLTKRLQEVNQAMTDFRAKGGDIKMPSYQALEQEYLNILSRRKEIEKMDIAEVNQYRQQMTIQAYQADLSAFVQNEAEKKAKAIQTATEMGRQYAQSFDGAMKQFNNLMSGDASGKLTMNLENVKRVLNDLKTASGKLNLLNPNDVQKAEQLKTAIAELTKIYNKYKANATAPPSVIDPQDAIKAAQQAQTLHQLKQAYKDLKEAMSHLKDTDPVWQQMNQLMQQAKQKIDETKRKMGEFNNEVKKTGGLLDNLKGKIATAFSVAAVIGYLRKMVDIRAQFELQRVALGAIIQDTDEANKTFVKIQNMALESPFTIMQLERATKQIAAFGFETKKLVPTMKMFADISAGLGVEIDRLVLVMGHLKARNFLEGTMVRQFTNMGFNILGNLAEYYSKLEDRMVSVGEVQDRVKKKMVSFEDVEEVLKRVTSAGGMFYDMQKKQSDSIWGQMQRIKDATDLMLNSIGQSNEGAIKFVLSTIRSAINSWRTLLPLIKGVSSAIGVYFTTAMLMKGIPMLINNITTGFRALFSAQVASKVAQDGLNASMMANPYAAIIATVIGLGMALKEVIFAQDELTEAMDRVREEGIGNMYNLIMQYEQLTQTVNDTNKSYTERQEALTELNRIFGEILPQEMLEEEYIRNIGDNYEKATEAIKAYSAEKIKANLKSEIENIQGKDILKNINDFGDWLDKYFNPSKYLPINTFRTAVTTIMTEISEEVKNGSMPVEKAVEELKERIRNRFKNIIPEDSLNNVLFYQMDEKVGFLGKNLDEWVDGMRKYREEVAGIDVGIEGAESKELQQVKLDWELLTEAVNQYKIAIDAVRSAQNNGDLNKIKMDGQGNFTADTESQAGQDALKQLNDALDMVQDKTKLFGVTWTTTAEDVNNAIASNVGKMEYFDKITNTALLGSLNTFNRWSDRFRNDNSVKVWWQNTKDSTERAMSAVQADVRNTMNLIAQKSGVQISIFDKLRLDGVQSYDDVRKEAKRLSDEAEENILRIAAVRAELLKLGRTAAQAQAEAEKVVGTTEEQAKQEAEAYKSLWKAVGGYEKKKKSKKSSKGQDKELKKWQDIKKAIEDVSTEYDKLRKSYDVEKSNERIGKLYTKVFEELGVKIGDFYQEGTYDAEQLIKALRVLQGLVKPSTDERKKLRSDIERSVDKTQVEIDLKLAKESEEKFKKDIANLFDNYALTKELKDVGLNVDLTYMVGGKPTTLEDVRRQLDEWLAEKGGEEAGEEYVKMYKDAQKKITDIEVKEQKQRLKNYEKYLKVMYSERAKKMIESYTTLELMEKDFQKNIQQLQSEMEAPDTTKERREELAKLIDTLREQGIEASLGIQRELSQAMAKADWESFKGSEIFVAMYQDLETLSKKGIDALIERLETVRDKLQSMENVDPKAVREVTQYIEKLRNTKIELSPYQGFKDALQVAKDLKKEYGSIEKAQLKLVELNDKALGYEQEVADLETIIDLKNKGVDISTLEGDDAERLNSLYEENKDNLQEALNIARQNLKTTQSEASALGGQVEEAKKLGKAYQSQMARMDKYKEHILSITGSIFDMADALGGEVDEEWKNLANSIIEATFQAISLQLQMQILGVQAQILGVEMNSALGIIGWVATALQVVANLLMAVFAAHDKRLQKQIENLQEEVDNLDKAFQKLEKSIERAFTIGSENKLTEKAISNIERQKKAYQEMIRLEEAKKKTDDEKIKEYKEKIEDLNDTLEELYETRHEKWGSTNDVWDEANNWVDAWLDAFKETGDGLGSLNESWDEFYENLVKKQAVSKVLGDRMNSWIEEINKAIDSKMDEYDMVDVYRQLGEKFKSEFGNVNEWLKQFFEYAGIGGSGEYVLSDLQKGIQNITEPQAAAIEAYLNSMRFAVYRHTEQLDILITTIQAQYGAGESPMLQEVRLIRSVVDSINTQLGRVIVNKNATNTNYVLKVG